MSQEILILNIQIPPNLDYSLPLKETHGPVEHDQVDLGVDDGEGWYLLLLADLTLTR